MPMRYEIQLKGVDEQILRLERLSTTAQRHMKVAMQRSVARIVSTVKPITPVDTGRLRRSIGGRSRVARGQVVGIVSTRVRYAGFVEFGTRFMRPRRYMARGFRAARDTIRRYFQEAIRKIVRDLKVNA